MGTGKWKLFDGWIAIFGWLDSHFLAVVSLKLTMFLFFLGRNPQDNFNYWDLWDFVLGGTPKIVGKTEISFFLQGKFPQGSIKNWDLWDFFWGSTPKVVSKTGISGIFFWEVTPR